MLDIRASNYISPNRRAAMLHFYGTDNPADLVTIDDGGGYVRVMHKDKARELGLTHRIMGKPAGAGER